MAEEHHSLTRLAWLFIVAALLGGCSLLASQPAPPSSPVPAPPAPGSLPASVPPPSVPAPKPPQPSRENRLSPATRSLVAQARTQMSSGDLDGASSTLDRALRIEPNNPLLWIELGRLRLGESDAHQAEVCGRKALALASGDQGTQSQARRLLADALRAQRRNQEAQEVESQPFVH
jgi:uncharacterized protein HemY